MMRIKNRHTQKTIIEIDDDGTLRYLDVNEQAKHYPAPVDVDQDTEEEVDGTGNAG